MSDDPIVLLSVSQEEHDHILTLARQRGFNTPADYLRALIEADTTEEDDDDDVIRESIKQGLREALRGEGIPIDDVWALLKNDE